MGSISGSLPCMRPKNGPVQGLLQNENSRRLLLEQRWINLGLPERICEVAPDCVEFLIESQFAYLIVMFRSGDEPHSDIREERNGEVSLKMNGEYRPWKEIAKEIYFDTHQGKVVSRFNSELAYNYISPDGIVQRDPLPSQLYPVKQLSKQEQLSLMEHAKSYWKTNTEIDPGQEKECIIQIVTSIEDKLPAGWLTDNLNDRFPAHNFIRLIDKDGAVYSFGSRATKETESFVLTGGPKCLASGYSKLAVPDFSESRYFDAQVTTSIPLTQTRLNQILQFSGEINQSGGTEFCFLKPNCNTFVGHVASMAGVTVNTTMGFGQLLSGMLPDIRKAPVIGGVFAAITEAVSTVTTPIFAALETHTPAPLQQFAAFASDVISFIPRKIQALFFNTLFLMFGGIDEQAEPNRPHDKKFASPEDFFNENSSDVDHSWLLTTWQYKQPSTHIHFYDGAPGMHIAFHKGK